MGFFYFLLLFLSAYIQTLKCEILLQFYCHGHIIFTLIIQFLSYYLLI